MFKNLGVKLQKIGAKATVKAVEYAPQIMFGFGVVAFGATIYMTVKATPKMNDILKDHEEKINTLHKEKESDENYSEKDYSKDIREVYKNTIIRTVRVAGPVAGMAVITVSLFGGSEYIVFKRLGKISTEYMILDKTFKEYREMVREEEGEEKDRHYMFKTRMEKEKVPVLDEDGNTEEKEEEKEVGSPNSIFYTWSEETSSAYYGIELYDDTTLKNKEKEIGKMLDRNGFVTDNDILYCLKMYDEVKRNGTFGMLYGVNAAKNTGNEFKFDVKKIWVPDYKKGYGYILKYQLRWDREKL